ncbi:MAG: rod-binding protein [Candidatus Hydrogenedentes bacterium]|nr:rod-binding protein [Candidatus Hydrogenedentota bacterium]
MLYVMPVSLSYPVELNEVGDMVRKKNACEEFERIFLYEVFKELRKPILKSKLFPESSSKRIYDDMLTDALAGEIAKSHQLGIADYFLNEITRFENQSKEIVINADK